MLPHEVLVGPFTMQRREIRSCSSTGTNGDARGTSSFEVTVNWFEELRATLGSDLSGPAIGRNRRCKRHSKRGASW